MYFFFCYTALILITLMVLWIHRTCSVRKEADKDLISDNCLLIIAGIKLKNTVHTVCFCVTLF